jgi:2-dehydro-3-deoxygluconokinase
MTRFVSIGECMIELRKARQDTFKRAYAGDTLNAAVYLKRTAPEIEVQFVTAAGRDRLSAAMRDAWKAEGIDDSLAFIMPGAQPGMYLVEVDKKGERRFLYWRDRSAARHWLRLLMQNGGAERLAEASLVYLSGVSLAILSDADRAVAFELLAELHRRNVRLAFSPNLRPQLWPDMVRARFAAEEAARYSSILVPSMEDGRLLYETDDPKRVLSHFSGRGASELIITRGAQGCIVSAGGDVWELPAVPTERVDSAGAGDAFRGVYFARRLQGATPHLAAQAALEVAARVAAHRGTMVPKNISHPDRESE